MTDAANLPDRLPLRLGTAGPQPAPDPALHPAAYDGVVGRRIFAFLLDALVIGTLYVGVWFAVMLASIATFGLFTPLGIAILAALPTLYRVLMIGGPGGATLGMRACGIALSGDADGTAPGYLRALVHAVLFVVTTGATGGLVLLLVLFDRKRRTLHDLACGLVMLRRTATPQLHTRNSWSSGPNAPHT